MSKPAARLTAREIAPLVAKFFASPNVELVDFSLRAFGEEKLGYLGVHELLTVEAKADGAMKVLTFFVKSGAPTGNEFDALIAREEGRFFGDAVPRMMQGTRMQSWAAECFLAREDLLVLEDLRAKGFRVVADLGEKELRSAVACVARLHAASMLLENRLKMCLGDVYADSFKEKIFVNDGGLAWKWLLTGVEVVEAIASDLGLDPSRVMAAYETMLRKVQPVKGDQNVLCHADLWCNNIMFSLDGEDCRLVDFQKVTYSSYALDLVQLLHLNATRDERRKIEKDLIGLYHSTLNRVLGENGFDEGKMVSLDEVLRIVDDKRICGLVTAVQYLQVALLNKEEADEYSKDVDKWERYMYVSRKDFILGVMRRDQKYRDRIEDAVRELVEFMEQR